MVTCFEFAVKYGFSEKATFGRALGDPAVFLGAPGVSCCQDSGCQGPTRGFLAVGAPTAVVIFVTSVIVAGCTGSTLGWRQSERFARPAVGAV